MALRVICCALAAVVTCLGCGQQDRGTTAGGVPAVRREVAAGSKFYADSAAPAAPSEQSGVQAFRFNVAPASTPPQEASKKSAQAVDQKIIYTGHLSVVARDFDAAEPKVREVVKKHKAYIADAQVQRNQGARPSATWVIRTPAESFDDCMHDLAGLGVPEMQRVATQDVGEEYVDVASRVASKKKVEERILEMVKERKGDLKEVMELENKLGAVREEIERAQGRLNFLTNRVAFSTINLTLREERDYVPPQTPDFAGQVADAWKTSTGSFLKFLQQVALFAVSIAPWLPVWLILGVAGWLLARRLHRATAPRPTA